MAWIRQTIDAAVLLVLQLRHPFNAFIVWLSLIVGITGGGVGIFLATVDNQSIREWVLSLALALLAVAALTLLGIRELTRAKHTRLASSLPFIEEISDKLRDVRTFLASNVEATLQGNDIPQDVLLRARDVIEEVLTAFAKMFSTLTGTHCRSCIKLIEVNIDPETMEPNTDALITFAIARDRNSARVNGRHDKHRHEIRIDTLTGNTDFLSLWDEDKEDPGYFFSNNLRKEKEYSTTSRNYWANVVGDPNSPQQPKWSLPYESTIVWPIRQEPSDRLGIISYRTIGFLTIDSPRRNAFDKDTHVQLGTILANALFPTMLLFYELTEPAKRETPAEDTCHEPEPQQGTTPSQA